jgi:hypothetical protein
METIQMSFKPFPPGTVRGPFICGKGTKHDGGIQYAVKCLDGSWRYFIKANTYEGKQEAKQEANLYALDMFKNSQNSI